MKFNIKVWEWFTDTWSAVLGKAIEKLTSADGKQGLSWEDIQITAELMRQAEFNFGTGAERREWVLEQITKLRGIVLPHLKELLFWMALNFAKSKGWISLGGVLKEIIRK